MTDQAETVVLSGGRPTHGELAGVLVLESPAPRVPGDLGHAGTFGFPVRYGVPRGFPFADLVAGDPSRLGLVIETIRELVGAGVRFVVADCGFFSVFHREISAAVTVPFLSSSLMLIPLIERWLPAGGQVGVLTGHAGLLHQRHLEPVGADLARVAVAGMESEPEFSRVVLGGEQQLRPERMRADTVRAAERLCREHPDVGAIVLECTNLITYRSDVQRATSRPVYDALSLVELAASGFRFRDFAPEYL